MSFHAPAAPLPTQPPARGLGKAVEDGQGPWDPGPGRSTLFFASDQLSSGCRSYMGSNPLDGRSLSLLSTKIGFPIKKILMYILHWYIISILKLFIV